MTSCGRSTCRRALEPEVAYGIAVVSDSDNAELADEFITGLLEGPGAEDLADAGFLPPAGGP